MSGKKKKKGIEKKQQLSRRGREEKKRGEVTPSFSHEKWEKGESIPFTFRIEEKGKRGRRRLILLP